MKEVEKFLDTIRSESADLMPVAANAEIGSDIATLKEVIDEQDRLLRALGNYAYRLEQQLLVDNLTKIASVVDFETNILPELDGFYDKDDYSQERKFPADYILLFVDMDGLGEINRQRGHRGGDEALINCAKALKSITRNVDWVGRSGSRADEFLVLIRLTDKQAEMETEIICESLSERIDRALHEIDETISISIGSARASECEDTEDLMHKADTRMFSSKVANYAKRGIDYYKNR